MNRSILPGFLAFIIVVVLIVTKSSMYIIPEGRQVVITEFGKPVGEPRTEAGLYFKKPFIQETVFVDKRILSWDGYPNQIPTQDQKFIKVDTTARWKIVDALKFIQTVQNVNGAQSKLDAILDAATRDVITAHNLVEAVRNSNGIIEKLDEKKQEGKGAEEITGEIEEIQSGREALSRRIVENATGELVPFGIALVDVQLRRISYEKSVEQKVYERMRSERQRIAQKIRSIGQGEKAKIEGRITKDLREIESEAYRKSQIIRGKAEAEAIAIYAKNLSKGPAFYEFTRSMEAYKKSFPKGTKFLLSSESEFLKYFKQD